MDIQKNQTQESFEKLYVKNAPDWSLERDQDGGYKYHATQSAFLLFEEQQIEIDLLKAELAKAQAVLEGFVLVPKLLSDVKADQFAESRFNEIKKLFDNDHRDLSAFERESLRLRWVKNRARASQEIYRAMIEAQEQSSPQAIYPNIFRAAKEIWYDNGMINQFEPIEEKIEQLSVWLKTLDADELSKYNEKLNLTDDDLGEVCCGEETLAYQILPDEAVHDFLGRIFDEEYAPEAQEPAND